MVQARAEQPSVESHGPWFGLLLAAVAILFLASSGGASAPHIGPGDPGPWAVPVHMSGFLLVGAVVELFRWWRSGGTRRPATLGSSSDERAGRWRMVTLAAGIAVYIGAVLVPWVGFSLATLLFVSILLTVLGSRWWVAMAIALVLVVVIRLLFSRLFQVPLPEGPLQNLLP